MRWLAALALTTLGTTAYAQEPAKRSDANRLAYLDSVDLYYPHRDFAKLTTPQWVGEPGVDAVVVLAIDDLRDPKRYESYLRPILRRLQQIDGRAPVSIMCCQVDPGDAQYQTWLKEGLSLECHTFEHPCPCFKKGFEPAKGTYEQCVDLLARVPESRPVAFRMPCCDSLNTPSPRFYGEVFARTTAAGNFLTLDSSVFNVFTSADPELPKSLTLGADGQERFARYLPKDRRFVNTIENYPYPYPIGNACWQFPCVTPSDWQAQHLQKANHPQTVADWKAALECTAIKKGVFCLVFHPHGWISAENVVSFIDDAVARFGKRVKFLTFKECHDRLLANVQGGVALRRADAKLRGDAGVRILDVDGDGYLDAVTPNQTRVWRPAKQAWEIVPFPISLDETSVDFMSEGLYRHRNFGVLDATGAASLVMATFRGPDVWTFRGAEWAKATPATPDFVLGDLLLRDLDGDGRCELICDYRPNVRGVRRWSEKEKAWVATGAKLPDDAKLRECRFVDLDGDGTLDLVYSNEKGFAVQRFESLEKGWRTTFAGPRDALGALPLVTRRGADNGFFVRDGHLWWSNEDTAPLKDHVDSRKISDLLKR